MLLLTCQAKKERKKENSSVLKSKKDVSTKKPSEKSTKKTSKSNTEEHITMGATQRSEGLRTAHVEDSFDRLKPRQMFVDRYNEIVDAKANRQNSDYDTLKLVVDEDFGKDVAIVH